MFLYAFSELMLRNAWLDLFEIEETTPSYIEFIELEKESTRIKYVFEYNEKKYEGSRDVINEIIKNRLPKNKKEIEVSFNTLVPKVNYLGQLNLKNRTGYVGMTISSFFLVFLILIDLFGNKGKWLKIYGLKK